MPAEADTVELDPTRPLPEQMARLADTMATGALVVESEGLSRTIHFVDGEIRSATSSAEREKLGAWLVERSLIDDNARALVLLAQGGNGALPLGQLLLERALLDLDTLEVELEELTLTIIRRAVASGELESRFEPSSGPGPLDTLPNMTTPQLILIAARAFPDLDAKRAAVGPLDQVAQPVSGLDTLLEELNLTPPEAFLLSRLDGTHRLSTVVAISALGDEEVISTLYGLKLAGVLSIGIDTLPVPAAFPYSGSRRSGGQEPPPLVDESSLSTSHREERRSIRHLAERVVSVDHYEALRTRRGARPNEIRDAWMTIAEHFDPSRSTNPHLRDLEPQLTSIYGRAREAYDVLSDSISRRRYDQVLRAIEEEQERLAGPAEQRFEIDTRVRNELVEANLQRANELIRDGEVYLAIQLLEQACAFEPRPPELVKLARLLLRNPLWANRALSSLRRAVEIDSGHVEAWIELAEFWRRRKHVERQRKALERALGAEPEHTRAQQMYAQLVGKRNLERLKRKLRRTTS